MEGNRLPALRTGVPGPGSRALAARLRRVECRGISETTHPPIVLTRAHGSNVHDVDGNRFVDLVCGFGASALGYSEPEVAHAVATQAGVLSQALGDVHPAEVKVQLLEALERVLPGDLGHAILSLSGAEAVESAIKTAMLATGRPGIVAFEGAYHGLGLGALDATHRGPFREPFRARLPERTRFVPFGDADAVRAATREGDVGAILVEPIQGRGGVRIPPAGFLPALREIADAEGILLIADEVWTGLGRTGSWLACDAEGVLPDVVALGKGLGGGIPISACVGRTEVMDRWPAAGGEAIHTSTHLGHPLGCAAALRVLEILERDGLVERARVRGARLLSDLQSALGSSPGIVEVRGRGLFVGIELESGEAAARACGDALRAGWILIADGDAGRVLTLCPALNATDELLRGAVDLLVEILNP